MRLVAVRGLLSRLRQVGEDAVQVAGRVGAARVEAEDPDYRGSFVLVVGRAGYSEKLGKVEAGWVGSDLDGQSLVEEFGGLWWDRIRQAPVTVIVPRRRLD